MIKFVTGSLLDAKVDALVNTVNTAGVMGKGLALQFRRLGGLAWRVVRPLIERGLVADAEVLVFEPSGAPAPEVMRRETRSRR